MKFLKKNMRVIIAFILGIILASGIVYAATYQAGDILYSKQGVSETNVKDALDKLYNISSTYKKLDTTTTAKASDILSGKTAYKNDGTIIQGTLSVNIFNKLVYQNIERTEFNMLNIDIKSKYSNYQNITIENILVQLDSILFGGEPTEEATYAVNPINYSYNNVTGILTITSAYNLFSMSSNGVTIIIIN